ncbi:flagellar hook-length control protein FliK, partial [Mesorhizobium sp. M7A.T.Ca.US.000.02.1.1]
MTTSLGSALPGFASTRATSEQPAANGRNDDPGFGKMLRDDAGAARPERQPSTEAGSRDQRWSKLAAGLAGHDAKAEPASAEPARTISAKVANVKTGKDDLEANAKADAEETAPDAEPLQDDLPLL